MINKNIPFNSLVQIAGVHDIEETLLLAKCGVHCVGLPLRLPVNKEDISEDGARELIQHTRNAILPVCITYLAEADAIIQLCKELQVSHIQLHGNVPLTELQKLAHIAPDLYLIKSLVIQSDGRNEEELYNLIRTTSPYVDAYITDTHNPVTGADGATGLTHDWNISARLVHVSPLPVILAGGLNPENVAEAIYKVQPAGVDAHTGVETPSGRKSAFLVRRFAEEAKSAFSALTS